MLVVMVMMVRGTIEMLVVMVMMVRGTVEMLVVNGYGNYKESTVKMLAVMVMMKRRSVEMSTIQVMMVRGTVEVLAVKVMLVMIMTPGILNVEKGEQCREAE